jgi:serine protease Do
LLTGTIALVWIVPALAMASDARLTPIVKVYQSAKPAVVSIRGEKTIPGVPSATGAAEAPRRVNGMGTGVIIDTRGYILTNYHVVDGVREIQVTTSSEKRYVATVIARDMETDLAIIKINSTEHLKVINIGTSSDLMPGETVVALGNAFGYDYTLTRGIISALHRAVQISDAQFYDDLIQCDSPINPGNSGGPLLNIDGEMIGVNVAVRAGAQGIGFAIPVDKAMATAAQLLANSGVKSWVGVVAAADVPAVGPGMKIASVERKSPASESGLRAGDVVTAVGDEDIHRALDFHRALLDRKPGEKVDLAVQREGKSITVSVVLSENPVAAHGGSGATWDVLGLELRPMAAAEFHQRFQTRYRGGLTVNEVRPNSPAADQGIRPGDVLVGMHIWETVTLDNVSYILKRPDFAALSPVKFYILRGNETLYGYMPLGIKVAQKM